MLQKETDDAHVDDDAEADVDGLPELPGLHSFLFHGHSLVVISSNA